MIDKVCEICQEYLSTHTITTYFGEKMQEHYLCDDDYQQLDNPKRFLSLLEYPLEEESVFKEIFPD